MSWVHSYRQPKGTHLHQASRWSIVWITPQDHQSWYNSLNLMCDVCFVYLSWVDYSCLEHTLFCWIFVCFCIKFFFIAGFYHFFYVKNPKTHKKEKIQKVWATLLSFVSKYVLSCTFVQMTLCIYEHSLFPMHSYHCGRNFETYVTVVNRSSTLSWMTSEWFC